MNSTYSSRTKHIEIKGNFIREKTESKIIDIKYVRTDERLADILTKPMVGNKQFFFQAKLVSFNFVYIYIFRQLNH